uniref:Candidate secreted effector n=1 Tax=Meloidogyne incognita TaxID=6306 RepID=A0A914NLI2_MELIC
MCWDRFNSSFFASCTDDKIHEFLPISSCDLPGVTGPKTQSNSVKEKYCLWLRKNKLWKNNKLRKNNYFKEMRKNRMPALLHRAD